MVLENRFSSMITAIQKRLRFPKQSLVENPDKWKPTIGIIGLNPNLVAITNKQFVMYGNENDLTKDQQFPETIGVGIKTDKVGGIEDQLRICRAYGSDVIIFAGNTKNSTITQDLEKRFHLPVFSIVKSPKETAAEVFKYCLNTKPIRPDILFHGDENEMFKKIQEDVRGRNKRIAKEESLGGYPILKNPTVGIIGGAGPLASACFAEALAETSTPFVHCSVNSAPGKHLFEIGKGPSYIDHYKAVALFLKSMKIKIITLPCNTAHTNLDKIILTGQEVVDIRKSVLDSNVNEEGFILIGTSRTVGIDLPEGQVGLYEELRKDYPDQGPFFIPSKENHSKILESIFDVKSGDLERAKRNIISVVKEMRKEHGYRKVILGCTELPLPFSDLELAEYELIDPSQSMAKAAKLEIDKETIRRNEEKNNSKNDYEEGGIEVRSVEKLGNSHQKYKGK